MKALCKEAIASLLPRRKENDNKYSVGTALAVTGSEYMTGAAVFSALGALYCGVGLYCQASDGPTLKILQTHLCEPIFIKNDLSSIAKRTERSGAVLFGCGTEINSHNEEIAEYILSEAKCPVVIDASGLTILSRRKDLLDKLSENVILTPHEKEMERISGSFPFDRECAAREFCEKHPCVLVLKGHNTLICRGGKASLNPTGNGGMAKGGYGDILAGMITAFAAQGLSPYDAACCGAYIHGLAGDITAERLGELSALPSEAVKNIPEALKRTYKQ